MAESENDIVDVGKWTVSDWRKVTRGLSEYNQQLLKIGVLLGSEGRQDIVNVMRNQVDQSNP